MYNYSVYNMLIKTAVPKVLQEVLPRRRIIETIDKSSLDEMIYLVAPYGCGKTMAVISWLREHNIEPAWVSLGEEEDSPISFWAYLSAAVLGLTDERNKMESILNSPCFVDAPQVFFRETLAQVSLEIDDKILVIDNFKFIQNSNLLREIKKTIYDMLGSWRIIIIGRNELPPIFNDFMLKKHLRLITLNELRFSLEELNEYFLMNMLAVDKKNLIQIHEDTDGWPAAINVVLTIPRNGDVRYNDTARAYVISYFEDKIWQHLSDKIRTFLLKTSVLDKLTPSICHYITDIEEAHLILRNLYVNGIFTSMLEERDTYCYQHVFRDFLLDRLSVSGIDVNGLYVKAGWWFYERNESIPALLYFYKSRNIYGINMAFKKIRPADMGMEKYLEATLCLTSLDVTDLKDCPEVAARIALLHFLTDNISEMKRIYKIILEWFEPGALSIPPEEYIDLYWEVGWLRYINPDEDIIFNDQFDEWMNIMEYAPHLLGNDRSRASALRLPSVLRGPRDFSTDVIRFEEYYKINIETKYSFINDEIVLFILDLSIAEIAYEREDFNKAEKIIRKVMPKIEKLKLMDLYLSATCLLVKLSRAVHNPKEIDELADRAKTLIMNSGHLFLIPNFHAFELRNRLADGIPGVTEIFEKENKPYKDNSYYYLIYRHITYVRALLSESKYSEALLILGNLEFLCRQYKRNFDLIEINILRSVAEYGLEYESDACRHLKAALDNGRKCGFIRIFSDDAAILWPVLNLIRKYDEDTYVKKIIISCKKVLARSGTFTQSEKNAHESLTRKERIILRLLHAGMSYEEIALDNHIKVGTVRAHIHSIYSKLKVDNKLSAIVIAQKSGIIESTPLLWEL